MCRSGAAHPTCPSRRTVSGALRQDLELRWCMPLAAAGVRNRTVFEIGHARDVLQREAETAVADLIVTGSRGHGGLVERLGGSVSPRMVHCQRSPRALPGRGGAPGASAPSNPPKPRPARAADPWGHDEPPGAPTPSFGPVRRRRSPIPYRAPHGPGRQAVAKVGCRPAWLVPTKQREATEWTTQPHTCISGSS
jgi:hypothetical protein